MRWPFKFLTFRFPILSPPMRVALRRTLTRLVFFPFQTGGRSVILGDTRGAGTLQLHSGEMFYSTLDGHVWRKDGQDFIIDLRVALLYEHVSSMVPGVTRYLTQGMVKRPQAVRPPMTPLSAYNGSHKMPTPETLESFDADMASFNADILETFGPDHLGLGEIPESQIEAFLAEEPEDDEIQFSTAYVHTPEGVIEYKEEATGSGEE